MMGHIYEIIHICTAAVDETEESSQQIFQFKQLAIFSSAEISENAAACIGVK